MMLRPPFLTSGQTSAQYRVQATTRSSRPSAARMTVALGCRQTTRRGVWSEATDSMVQALRFFGGRAFYTIASHPLQSRGGSQSIMFIHMFAFRWKAGVTEEQKQRVIAEIRKLQGQIPGLVETFVGTNTSPRGQGFELGGVMKFTDEAALRAYGPHPIHQKLLTWLVPLIDPIEVDFEAGI